MSEMGGYYRLQTSDTSVIGEKNKMELEKLAVAIQKFMKLKPLPENLKEEALLKTMPTSMRKEERDALRRKKLSRVTGGSVRQCRSMIVATAILPERTFSSNKIKSVLALIFGLDLQLYRMFEDNQCEGTEFATIVATNSTFDKRALCGVRAQNIRLIRLVWFKLIKM